MIILVPPRFSKDAEKAGVTDDDLRAATSRAERGLIDGELAAYLIKQRVPREGQGRSGGFRTIIAYKHGELAVFLYVFPKNAKANLTKAETAAFAAYAKELVKFTNEDFARHISEQGWRRIDDEQPEEDVPK